MMSGLIHWFAVNAGVLAVLVAVAVAVLLTCCLCCSNCAHPEKDDIFNHHEV